MTQNHPHDHSGGNSLATLLPVSSFLSASPGDSSCNSYLGSLPELPTDGISGSYSHGIQSCPASLPVTLNGSQAQRNDFETQPAGELRPVEFGAASSGSNQPLDNGTSGPGLSSDGTFSDFCKTFAEKTEGETGHNTGTIPPAQVPLCPTDSEAERLGTACEEYRGPLADSARQVRPGVSNNTLRKNGVTETNFGSNGTWGLKIPYFTFEASETGRCPVRDLRTGDNFSRERLAWPTAERKYSQPPGTSPAAYFPLGLAELVREHECVILTEGEFKALSLVEAGYPAVGIGGIFNFQAEGELLPELVEFFEWTKMEGIALTAVHFLGDSDTTLNHQFAGAAIKLRDLLKAKHITAPLRLPRMPLQEMRDRKGIDDAREAMSCEDFGPYMDQLLAGATSVPEHLEAGDLVMILLNRDKQGLITLLESATAEEKPAYSRKLARLANAAGSVGSDQIADLAIEAGLFSGKKQFREEMKRQKHAVAKDMEQKRPRSPVPLYYWPSGTKSYLYMGENGYTKVDRTGALNHLAKAGYSKKPAAPSELSEADLFITHAEERPIDWAGALAGCRMGLVERNGLQLLVTKSPKLLTPAWGSWTTIREFLESRLNYDPNTDPNPVKQAMYAKQQINYFLGYLAHAVRSLYRGNGGMTPAQALVLCGSGGVGKNTLQEIITELLGGRQADPFDFMEGSCGFNGELAGNEHWMIADKQSSARYADREKMKSCIKEACVNRIVRVNEKHKHPINIELWRRLSISLNDDEECLRVLPNLTDDVVDKLMILHVVGRAFHGPGTAFESFDAWRRQIRAEMPAFLHYLLDEHVIEPALADNRYGITSYHDPEIVARIQNQSPEGRLLKILEVYAKPFFNGKQELTAHELLKLIREWEGYSELALIKCDSVIKLGERLSQLVKNDPTRFSSRVIQGFTHYRVKSLAENEQM